MIARTAQGKVECEISKLLKATDWPEETEVVLKPDSAQPPHHDGLPKIQKVVGPLCTIVNTTGTPTYETAKYVASLLNPLLGKIKYYIKIGLLFFRCWTHCKSPLETCW